MFRNVKENEKYTFQSLDVETTYYIAEINDSGFLGQVLFKIKRKA